MEPQTRLPHLLPVGAEPARKAAQTAEAGQTRRADPRGLEPRARIAEIADRIPRSQTVSMARVFARRVIPFVSFDMISYAPGLGVLHAWRVALATLAGVVPASFVLAHFGGAAVSGDLGGAVWTVPGLGLVTGLLLWVALRRGKRAKI